ncbi:MAG TPA: ATP-dependent DNA helicase RecG [Acidimicrobiales bacterium]|nr:ATP-dependent DNA helicase RecG [Acidimicrobiales bacterium]
MSAPEGRTLAYLDTVPVTEVKRVGPKRAGALEDMGIATVYDLLTHYPHRYIDRTREAAIGELAAGEEATVLATVRRVNARRTRQRRTLVEVDVSDGRAYLRLTFFNQSWRSRQLKAGQDVAVFGRVESYRGRLQMTNPVVDLIGDRTSRIVPVYPQSEKAGVSTWELAECVAEALRRVPELEDPVPAEHLSHLGLVGRSEAFHHIHRPATMADAQRARKRLAFDELLRLQAELVARKRSLERQAVGIPHTVAGEEDLLGRFRRCLPFTLTEAQDQALTQILGDLARPRPMHRLLQGDVGSGKTVVAVAALLVAVQGGHQGAVMAPTEVLAEQHHLAVRDLVAPLTVADDGPGRAVRVALLTNRTTAAERTRLHADLRAGSVDILVGTHALLTEEVSFASLGVVVIDEQHRFGVNQRAVLREKGRASGGADPDVLVMTATPIPRSAAMTVFGDLDVTEMRERPPGRTPVRTSWARGPLEVQAAWDKVREQVAEGRRAYVVCPLVEGSERVEAASAVEEAERLSRAELAGVPLGLLHGQLSAREKEAVMASFRRGEVGVLVATTVIEVGVDVPDATVMVIEDAERFGMAQLHQLRGRVGRGEATSWCYLLGTASSPEAERRLEVLASSDDGFVLAEEDLDLRGEGTILGVRQKGRSDLKLASLRRDRALVGEARRVAFAMDGEAGLAHTHPNLAEEVRRLLADEEAAYLFKG